LTKKGYVILLLVGLGIALLVTLFSPLASSKPDGLERVAEDKAFVDKGKDAPYEVITDYAFPWVDNEDAATILAGIVGVLVVTALVIGLGLGFTALSRRASLSAAKSGGPAPPVSGGGGTASGGDAASRGKS
jgi:multisubunit Na+/H+ antiporter MnhC subunit